MGCVLSNLDEEEKIRICKERKKLVKQLVVIREFFSDSQLAYLTALRNTGATLRQFTESDSLELENISDGIGMAGPPSPSLALPPSPPPPPAPLSPDKTSSMQVTHQSSNSLSDYLFGLSSPYQEGDQIVEVETEENWAETNTEFEDEDSELHAGASGVVNPLSKKQQCREPVDDSCALRFYTKESTNLSTLVGGRKKSLEAIVKELDECFLKASEGRKEIAVLIDISRGDILLRQSSGHEKTKRSNSAKVFSVLPWNRHSKSSQYNRESAELSGPSGPCMPGAHCATLKKLYAAEKRLVKLVKEEEITKLEHQRKSLLLQKKVDENLDWTKTEKTRSSVENLESNLIRLRQSISETTSSILEFMDEELCPQILALASGLTQMWRTMHECHQVQCLISQQLSHHSDNQSIILNSEYHHQATLQLETEVMYWYNSFCNLVKSQREYVRVLHKWIELTYDLMDDHKRSAYASRIHGISEQWEHGLDKLPDKETSEAIKSLLSSIRCIIAWQAEEHKLQKKVGKLERKMQKELISLDEMEKELQWSCDTGDKPMSPSHPLSVKQAKTEALKKQLESEKANYLKTVEVNKAMTLNTLISTLPHVFHALSSFSSAYVEAVDVVNGQAKPPPECNDTATLEN